MLWKVRLFFMLMAYWAPQSSRGFIMLMFYSGLGPFWQNCQPVALFWRLHRHNSDMTLILMILIQIKNKSFSSYQPGKGTKSLHCCVLAVCWSCNISNSCRCCDATILFSCNWNSVWSCRRSLPDNVKAIEEFLYDAEMTRAQPFKALLTDNVCTVKFLFLKMLLQIGDCGSMYGWLHIVKKKSNLMCICTVLQRNSSLCYCFCRLIMQWFPSVARRKRNSLAELLKQSLYLIQKQYFKGWNMLLIDGTKAAGWIAMTAAVSASITSYSTGKQVHAQ